MAHVLQFDEQSRKVKDANMQDEDTFEIYDPRNPVNKRRREESKKILKEKKAKRWGHKVIGRAEAMWLKPKLAVQHPGSLPFHCFKPGFGEPFPGANITNEDAEPKTWCPRFLWGNGFFTASPEQLLIRRKKIVNLTCNVHLYDFVFSVYS